MALQLAERGKSIPVASNNIVHLRRLYKNVVNEELLFTNITAKDKHSDAVIIVYTKVLTGEIEFRPLTEWIEIITLDGGKRSPRHILYETV